MQNGYMTVKEAAERWCISLRRVQKLITDGRVSGAVKLGHNWVVPIYCEKPRDRRCKEKETIRHNFYTLPVKCPELIFTPLYSEPGSGDRVLESLVGDTAAQELFAAQLAYFRGEIDEANRLANRLLYGTDRPDVRLGSLFLLALCSMYLGDSELWLHSSRLIKELPCSSPAEEAQRDFQLANISSGICDQNGFPEWFCRGNFDVLPTDCFPLARFIFLKYLMITRGDPGVSVICGPLISQCRAEGALLAEIYCLILTAIGYHDRGDTENATTLLDRAITLALPDRLLSPLAEYRSEFGVLLDERIEMADKVALTDVRELHKRLISGWGVLCREILGLKYTDNLTQRERHAAKLAAKGLTNAEIAVRMNVSVNSVKRYISEIIGKTGAPNRNAIADYIALTGETLP